jgi:hypothetical protein
MALHGMQIGEVEVKIPPKPPGVWHDYVPISARDGIFECYVCGQNPCAPNLDDDTATIELLDKAIRDALDHAVGWTTVGWTSRPAKDPNEIIAQMTNILNNALSTKDST